MKRKSIITEYMDYSAISGSPAECVHHCCFGIGKRSFSEREGLLLPLTNAEHNMGKFSLHGNPTAEALSKMVGQLAYEKNCYREMYIAQTGDETDVAREQFRKAYGESYL